MVAIQLPSAVEIILFLFKVTLMYPLFICTNLAPIASGDVFLTRTKRKNKTLISLRNREALYVSVILQQMEASEDTLISRFGEPIKMDQIQHLFTACFLQPYLQRLQGEFSARSFLLQSILTIPVNYFVVISVWKADTFFRCLEMAK